MWLIFDSHWFSTYTNSITALHSYKHTHHHHSLLVSLFINLYMQWVSELPEMRSTSVVAVRGEGSFHGNWKTRPNSMYQSCQSDRKKRKERECREKKRRRTNIFSWRLRRLKCHHPFSPTQHTNTHTQTDVHWRIHFHHPIQSQVCRVIYISWNLSIAKS